MGDELSCGQTRDWYTHTHTHTLTHRPTDTGDDNTRRPKLASGKNDDDNNDTKLYVSHYSNTAKVICEWCKPSVGNTEYVSYVLFKICKLLFWFHTELFLTGRHHSMELVKFCKSEAYVSTSDLVWIMMFHLSCIKLLPITWYSSPIRYQRKQIQQSDTQESKLNFL